MRQLCIIFSVLNLFINSEFILKFYQTRQQFKQQVTYLQQRLEQFGTRTQQQQEDQYQPQLIYLGDYRITFYCNCSQCARDWAGSPTASGAYPTSGYTCACGSDISFGTHLYVQGLGEYVCEDRGVGNGCVDIYLDDHNDAPSWGMDYRAVYLIQ